MLALWSGLGYYSRARNLRRAAQRIAAAGGFPRDYAAIRALPGIGDYTAAAVASIAFGLPYAVLDGNVLRVVARVENDAADISSRTRERFRAIAQQWLDPREPGPFQPGADGTGRHGLPAAQSAVPGLSALRMLPGAAGRHDRATAGETAQDRTGAAGRRAVGGA